MLPSHGPLIQASDGYKQNKAADAAVPLPKVALKVKEEPKPAKTQKAAKDVLVNPQYPGGDDAMRKYITDNFKYPAEARDADTHGTIYVGFVVEADGSITCVNVLRGLNGPGGKLCNAEAKRLIANMPRWKPGKINGVATRVQMNVPVILKLK